MLVCVAAIAMPLSAQVKKTQRPAKPTAAPAVSPTPEPTPEKQKKNERPGNGSNATSQTATYVPTHFYEFERPGFLTSRILIEHDDNGKGKISFLKKDFDELMSDPLQLSAATVEGIEKAFERLTFLDSTEDYQYEKDYSHLGISTIKLRRGGRERSIKISWTTNADAKFLMDEYRRISNEYVWKFDMVVTRENQPLESPRMIEGLDSYFRRGEISDPPHMLPFLQELSEDERLPLIARNHVKRLIKQIEKSKK
ncbi:MAG: hypothetical protein KA746_10730 [Pyrinomonadaceae bacterium]|nr:hypothetical protein [Pyrinomonadaceae bacterium]MBP6213062.1 hypothetical protein [Pyrinomonadaceae bacterium]